MKKVAVLGGGPAGAQAAEMLSAAGVNTILIDEKLAWEKPCGGGITYKAYEKYPYLFENETAKKVVTETYIGAHKSPSIKMNLNQPILIYSRLELNKLLLERADRAGAQIEQERVTAIEEREKGWSLKTRSGSIEADYVIVATGARNPLRDVGTQWTPDDTMVALGYYIPTTQPHIDIQFLDRLEGYIWVFPRQGHLSAGICGRGETAHQLRARLERYLDEKGINWKQGQLYAHMLPSLSRAHWRNNRVAGKRWMAVGDAAGFVDPITGEGIYYAIRSGDLASQVVCAATFDPVTAGAAYRSRIEEDFMHDLEFGASFAQKLYLGRFFFKSIPDCIVQYMQRSPKLYELMQDIFSGTQDYLSLRNRLFRNLNGTVNEAVVNFIFQRIIPEPPVGARVPAR
ncbi:NAD(P)/FAD-dependent oxidoreductase [Bryobacter aggregatus]|uniref:NAD(P)/FAD-dependent oxidoreductase n=1 Tax=Bryobacter aggregatus TaxID=360054 RepID=UPI0004E1414E|nr:NAD(P)/FAD-dependent oxidoreductase [Bryobacter aggregatus]